MRDLRHMSPDELDRYATAWLAEHDPRPTVRQPVDKTAPVEWSLSPVCAELDCDDEDAAEIAATFAALSGGRLATALVAHCTDEYARGMLARREYMRAARRDESKRLRWREAEKARRRAKAAALAREMAHVQRRAKRVPAAPWRRPEQLCFGWAAA